MAGCLRGRIAVRFLAHLAGENYFERIARSWPKYASTPILVILYCMFRFPYVPNQFEYSLIFLLIVMSASFY